jgi:hypothetical protein
MSQEILGFYGKDLRELTKEAVDRYCIANYIKLETRCSELFGMNYDNFRRILSPISKRHLPVEIILTILQVTNDEALRDGLGERIIRDYAFLKKVGEEIKKRPAEKQWCPFCGRNLNTGENK